MTDYYGELVDLYTKKIMSKYPSYKLREMNDKIEEIYTGLLNNEKRNFEQYKDNLDDDIRKNPRYYLTIRLSETTKSTTYARIMYYFMLSLVAKKNNNINIISRTFSVEDIRICYFWLIGSSGQGKNVNESFIKSIFNEYNKFLKKSDEKKYKDYYVLFTPSLASLTSASLLGGMDKDGIPKQGLFENKEFSVLSLHEAGDMFNDDQYNQYKKETLKLLCQQGDPLYRNTMMKSTLLGSTLISDCDKSAFMTSYTPDVVSREFIRGGTLRRSVFKNISKTTKEVDEMCISMNETLIGTGEIEYTKTEEKLIDSLVDLFWKITKNEQRIEISEGAIIEINRIYKDVSSLVSDSDNEICKILRVAINSHITKFSVLSAIDRIFTKDDEDFIVKASDVLEIEDLIQDIMENYIDFCLKEKKENIMINKENIEFVIQKALLLSKKSNKKVTAEEIFDNIHSPSIKELVSTKYINKYLNKQPKNDKNV